MKYMGSKNRHAKEILEVVLQERSPNQLFVDVFVGGANILDKVDGPRLGADIDEDVIALWQAVSLGWEPPEFFTERQYREIKAAPASPLRGYAAFALSYGGKKFGGWRRDSHNKRNYVTEAYRNAKIQFPKLHGVPFYCCSFLDLVIPDGSLVYCDPPYEGTTHYRTPFNHAVFWDWCRIVSQRHTLFVSEYHAPKDFVCVWEKPVAASLTANTGARTAVERLWRIL